jgi:hypothetical protein
MLRNNFGFKDFRPDYNNLPFCACRLDIPDNARQAVIEMDMFQTIQH